MRIIDRLLTWLGIRHDTVPMPIEDKGQTWYTVKEVSERVHMSRQRIHQYIDAGKIEPRTIAGIVWLSQPMIDWLRDHNNPETAP